MEHLRTATDQIRKQIWSTGIVLHLLVGLICLWLVGRGVLSDIQASIIFVLATVAVTGFVAWVGAKLAEAPLAAFGKAILHLSPSDIPVSPPDTENLEIGHEYVTNMVYKLYQITSLQDSKMLAEHKREATQASNILSRLPLPLFVFNNKQIVTFASDLALSYVGQESAAMFGKPIYETIDLEFPSELTLESWIKDCVNNKVNDTAYWRRVRIRLKDEAGTIRQCDLAGYYNRDNPSGIEFIITLFDRTQEYAQDEHSLSFIALAVHELRTPLTLMRALIEVFEDELEGKLDDEMTDFMERLRSSAQQLSTFVNNILNVAKIEQDQLAVKLSEQNWEEIVNSAVRDMDIKASSIGKHIHCSLPAKLPAVAVDRLMTYEVVCNLLDNAIKYSGSSKDIYVAVTINKDSLVETNVVDSGVGIPTSVLPSLFEKFHRNHRNRSEITGTGLGLYLSKAIVNAHGGDIWVNSKEGKGTTVSFTVKPYAMVADELKTGNNKDAMVRTAHGWIKNHSLYRN